MAIRRIKANQMRANHKCKWCGKPATQRSYGWGAAACGDHLSELTVVDQRDQAPDYSDAAYYARIP